MDAGKLVLSCATGLTGFFLAAASVASRAKRNPAGDGNEVKPEKKKRVMHLWARGMERRPSDRELEKLAEIETRAMNAVVEAQWAGGVQAWELQDLKQAYLKAQDEYAAARQHQANYDRAVEHLRSRYY